MSQPPRTGEPELVAFPTSKRPPAERLRVLHPARRLSRRSAARMTVAELVGVVAGSAGAAGATRCSLAKLLAREYDGWLARPGIGPARARRLAALSELCRRASESDRRPLPVVDGPRAAWRQLRALGRARKEQLVGVYLDAQNGVLRRETLSMGSLNTTRTHPREILYPAVRHLALAFVLAHNHPSGCLEPSREDVDFTRTIRDAADLFGIELYDHLIVTRDGYTSMRERGLL